MAQTDIRFTFEIPGNTEAEQEQSSPIELDVISFTLEESLNDAFVLEVELISHDSAIDFDKVIDHPAVFTIHQQGSPVRYVHGLVSDFEQGATGSRRTRYRAVVTPILSRAKIVSDWRIFQQQNAPEILAEVFKANQILNHLIESNKEHLAREYLVQPGIVDFDFIQYLAAEEGYVYRIESNAGGHRLLLTDIIQTFGTITTHRNGQKVEQNEENESEAADPVIYNPNPGGDRPEPALRSFTYRQRVRTAQQTQREYAFKNPRYSQEQNFYGGNLSGQSNQYERYDYPGRYKQDSVGKPFTQTKIQSLRNDAKVAICTGDDPRLEPGLAFQLNGHLREDWNVFWRPVRIVHIGKQHTAGEEESAMANAGTFYEQRAELVLATDNWKADIPAPHRIEGPLIAHVTGPDGEEIYCDEYGRVKVQFPWDRYGQENEHSSCWIRVSQNWAGAGWGHIAIPRIGQEVIVSFLGADESQPIITGRTYDAIHPTPYKLPALKTQQTTKSKEHKGSGYNELLIDDTTGEIKTQLHTTYQVTQLTMGYLTHPRDTDGNGEGRGEGFELRTDAWGAIRAGNGLYISTDKREKATGKQLDLQEAIKQLESALDMAKNLAQASQTTGSASSDIGTQESQLNEVYTDLQQAGILMSAPQGIATVTPSNVQISAGQNVALTAIQNTDISSLKDIRAIAGENVSVVAVESAMNLIANKGELKLQAQHNKMDINAKNDLTVTSSNGKVTVAAKDELMLTCGGAYIKIKGGKVEIGSSQILDVKTAGMSMSGPSTTDYGLPSFVKASVIPLETVIDPEKHEQQLKNAKFFLFSE